MVYGLDKRVEYRLMSDGTWSPVVYERTPGPSIAPTPSGTPASIPAITSAPTPASTPVTSPQCTSGTVTKKYKVEKEKEKDPRLLIVVRSDIVVQEMNNQQMKKEVNKGNIINYIYTNTAYHPDTVKKNILAGKYDLTRVRRVPLAFERFHQVKTGECINMIIQKKMERK